MSLVLFSHHCLHSTSHIHAPCHPIPQCIYNPLTFFRYILLVSSFHGFGFWCIQFLTASVGVDFVDQQKFLCGYSCHSLHISIPIASSKYSELELPNILGVRKSSYAYFLDDLEDSKRKFRNIVSLWRNYVQKVQTFVRWKYWEGGLFYSMLMHVYCSESKLHGCSFPYNFFEWETALTQAIFWQYFAMYFLFGWRVYLSRN